MYAFIVAVITILIILVVQQIHRRDNVHDNYRIFVGHVKTNYIHNYNISPDELEILMDVDYKLNNILLRIWITKTDQLIFQETVGNAIDMTQRLLTPVNQNMYDHRIRDAYYNELVTRGVIIEKEKPESNEIKTNKITKKKEK